MSASEIKRARVIIVHSNYVLLVILKGEKLLFIWSSFIEFFLYQQWIASVYHKHGIGSFIAFLFEFDVHTILGIQALPFQFNIQLFIVCLYGGWNIGNNLTPGKAHIRSSSCWIEVINQKREDGERFAIIFQKIFKLTPLMIGFNPIPDGKVTNFGGVWRPFWGL